MPNENTIIIDGHRLKEFRCKEDNCRELLGYESMALGVWVFFCRNGHKTVYNRHYKSHGKPLIDKLQKQFGKGGEKT